MAMSAYAFAPPPAPALPVVGETVLFPVRRVLCVGRNYAAHRREMGGDDRDPPFFFAKPADGLVPPGRDVAYPSETEDLHHEVELVVALSGGQTRQDAGVSDMSWNVAEIIAQASRLWRLAPGDLIYTGTPEGGSAIARGQAVRAEIEDVGQLEFKVV